MIFGRELFNLIRAEIRASEQRIIAEIRKGVTTLASDLTPIQNAVAAETAVDQSVETLLTQLSSQLADLKNDPAAIQALADQMTANATALAAAVTQNTPAQ